MDTVSGLVVAAHKRSVQAWDQQLSFDLETSARTTSGAASWLEEASLSCTVVANRSLLPAALVSPVAPTFQWPGPWDGRHMRGVCNHPTNYDHPNFKSHPPLRGRALEHF